MSKTTAIIELGYNTKIVCPIAKLSTLMTVLEACSIVNEEGMRVNFTGALNEHGGAEYEYQHYYVRTEQDITAKIVELPRILDKGEARAMREAAERAEERATADIDITHPYRLKVGNNEHFLTERFRTFDAARQYGKGHWTGSKKGFTIFERDDFAESFAGLEEAANG